MQKDDNLIIIYMEEKGSALLWKFEGALNLKIFMIIWKLRKYAHFCELYGYLYKNKKKL